MSRTLKVLKILIIFVIKSYALRAGCTATALQMFTYLFGGPKIKTYVLLREKSVKKTEDHLISYIDGPKTAKYLFVAFETRVIPNKNNVGTQKSGIGKRQLSTHFIITAATYKILL